MAEKKNSKRARKPLTKKYIVVFQDENNEVLKTTFVPEGGTAQPPDVPRKKGETAHHEIIFAGWDTDFASVHENLVVKAVYREEPKKYLVMYFHENDRLLGMESVPYGQAAQNPPRPEKASDEEYDYIFAGWNCPLDVIEGDTRARAMFHPQRKVFVVRYFHEDGTLLKEEQVEYGKTVQPPAQPEKAADPLYHYIFAGWSEEAGTVTGDRDIFAEFSSVYNEYRIGFYDGEALLSEKMYHYGDVIAYPAPRKKGYALRWDAAAVAGASGSATEAGAGTPGSGMEAGAGTPGSATEADAGTPGSATEADVGMPGSATKESAAEPGSVTGPGDTPPATVDGSYEIRARWTFAGPAGKRFETESGIYEIINPSVKNGSVRCLSYKVAEAADTGYPSADSVRVVLPERVRLGDYFYRVESIGAGAFRDCCQMEKLFLPDTLLHVEERGLAGCLRLREVHFGRNIRKLGADAFAGDIRLRTLIFPGTQLVKCHGSTFHRLPAAVRVRVPSTCRDKYERLFRAGIARGRVITERYG